MFNFQRKIVNTPKGKLNLCFITGEINDVRAFRNDDETTLEVIKRATNNKDFYIDKNWNGKFRRTVLGNSKNLYIAGTFVTKIE